MFSYRALFRQAWEISWRHKYLWFFGLFASVMVGGGSWEYQIMTQNFNQGLINGSYVRLESVLALGGMAQDLVLGFINLFSYDIWTILNVLSFLLVALTLLVFFVWLAVTSQAALIGSTKKLLETKKKENGLSIRGGLTAGHNHFWSVLALNFFSRILISFALFLIGLPLLFMVIKDNGILAAIYTILFIIFVPVAMSLSLLVKYAIAYEVLENKSLIAAWEHGWHLFIKHWLISVEAAVILFLINFVASGALVILLSLFLLPLIVLGMLFQAGWLVIAIVLLGIVIIIFFGSVMTTFQTAAWTNLFLRLKNEGGLAKLERVFRR